MSSQKDVWDKAEIVIKGLVPCGVALGAYLLNAEINARAVAQDRFSLAIGIISTPPEDKELGYSEDEIDLRAWAAKVVQNPRAENPMTQSLILRIERTHLSNLAWTDIMLGDKASLFDGAKFEFNLGERRPGRYWFPREGDTRVEDPDADPSAE